MARAMWRGIERRTKEALDLGDPSGRARALLGLLRRADDDWTWEEDQSAGWNRRVDAFSPVFDALVGVGPAAVDAILAGDAPPGPWYASTAAMALDELHGRRDAEGREEDVLDWLLRNAGDQDDVYLDAAQSIVDRAGARAVPALTRFVTGTGDGVLAMMLGYLLLDGADPVWAVPAAEEMLKQLARRGAGTTRALGPAFALFGLRGIEAGPAITEVIGRAAGGPGDQDRRVDDEVGSRLRGMLASMDHHGGDPDEGAADPLSGWDAMFGPDAGPLPCAGGEGECSPGCPLGDPLVGPEDIGAVPRFLLARACGELGLDAGGPKRELVERLWEHHERQLGLIVDPVPRGELEAMPTRELRERCEDLGLDEGGGRAELVERLDRFYRGEDAPDGPAEPFSRRELDAMTAAQLRTLCEDLGLPAGGRKDAMVARVLEAQGERAL